MASSMCACLHAAITPPVVPAEWLVCVPQVLCCAVLISCPHACREPWRWRCSGGEVKGSRSLMGHQYIRGAC